MELSKENIDKLIFGGIYRINNEDLKRWCPNQVERLNDQHYGLWIPVHSINKKRRRKLLHDRYLSDVKRLF